MGRPLDQQELRRRAVEGVRDEVEAFGCAAADSLLIRRKGLLASVVLDSRGHSLDGAPRAMAMDLGDLGEAPPAPAGIVAAPIEPGACAELNDAAYGFDDGGFGCVEMWELRR
jgi:hypothetical protein